MVDHDGHKMISDLLNSIDCWLPKKLIEQGVNFGYNNRSETFFTNNNLAISETIR